MEDSTTTKTPILNDDAQLLSELDLYVKDTAGRFQKKRGKEFLTNLGVQEPRPQPSTTTVYRGMSDREKRAQKAQQAFESLPWEPKPSKTVLQTPTPSIAIASAKATLPKTIQPLKAIELSKIASASPTQGLPSNLRQPLSDKSHAEFIYDIEDAEDIKKIEKSMPEVRGSQDASVAQNDKLIRDLIAQFQLPFDDFLTKRFGVIVNAYLKDIRGKEDTIDLCMRSIKVGGLGLSEEVASKVIGSLSSSQSVKTAPLSMQNVSASSFRRQQAERLRYSVGAVCHEIKEKEASTVSVPQPPRIQLLSPPPAPPSPPQPSYGSAGRPNPDRIVVNDPSKRKVADIQKKERVLGPVDEIRVMGPKEYRALGETPQEAVEKIKEKIDLLGEDSFTKRTEGINAWRESPLYQLYLSIGKLCMLQGADVNAVSLKLHQEDKPYLTNEEFLAIADLNHQLRY